MKDLDKPAFAKILIGTAQVYDKHVSEILIAAFWEILKQYDLQDVHRAFMNHLGNTDAGQFMPKPADIKRMIEGNTQEKALLAWSRVDFAVRCCGPYSSVVFDDPIIHVVLKDMGGLLRFSRVTYDQYSFLAEEFRKRYRGYMIQGVDSCPNQMLGLEALSKQEYNQSLPEPKFIGNREKCNQIYTREGENSMVLGKPISVLIANNIVSDPRQDSDQS